MKKKQEHSKATEANLELNKKFNKDGKQLDTAPFVYNQSAFASSEMNRELEKEREDDEWKNE
jgi:hypothetical protein